MTISIFGSINHDHVMRMDRITEPGETRMALGYESFFGGKGANQAVAAARSAPEDVKVIMLGAVGEDASGQAAIANFKANGVITDYLARSSAPTGTAQIMVDDTGENAISVYAGANATLTADSVPKDALTGTQYLVCQGEVAFAEVLTLSRRFKQMRPYGHLTVNLAPVPPDASANDLGRLLRLVDLLVLNEIEARQVIERLGIGASRHPDTLAQELAMYAHATLIITLGAQGAIVAWPTGDAARHPSTPITPVDTTGAGDTFVGVLVAGIAGGLQFEPAVRRAMHAGALACLGRGAQTSMPYRAELAAETVYD